MIHLLALPLRILLAFALVLNGAGGAVAGVAGPGPEAVLPIHDAAAATSGCPDHAGGGETVPDIDGPASGHPCSGEDTCSDDPQCLQACTHACVAVPQRFAIGVQVNGASPLHPFTTGHPSPPARSPIRPPIA